MTTLHGGPRDGLELAWPEGVDVAILPTAEPPFRFARYLPSGAFDGYTVDPDVSVECDQCARVFPDVTTLADHVAVTHGVELTDP